MLAGEYGEGVAKSLELLVALGEVFGAEKLVPVESAHVNISPHTLLRVCFRGLFTP